MTRMPARLRLRPAGVAVGIERHALEVLRRPGPFLWRTLAAFRANQGLLLAGGVAYYALLSLVPMLMLIVIALSHVIDEAELLETLGRYLNWLVPGQAAALVREVAAFLEHRAVVGGFVLATMIFFSSLAFTVLENAMSVIFHHRVSVRRRHFFVSAILPYCFIFCLGVGLLLVTLVSGSIDALGTQQVRWFGHAWSLGRVSGVLLYLLGVTGEVLLLTALYMVMPVGRLRLRHALVGGLCAALLWELTRHVLLWYFSTISQVNVVYGSLAVAIVVLLSLEIAAILVLYGAQVIAELERATLRAPDAAATPMHTARART